MLTIVVGKTKRKLQFRAQESETIADLMRRHEYEVGGGEGTSEAAKQRRHQRYEEWQRQRAVAKASPLADESLSKAERTLQRLNSHEEFQFHTPGQEFYTAALVRGSNENSQMQNVAAAPRAPAEGAAAVNSLDAMFPMVCHHAQHAHACALLYYACCIRYER